MIFYTAVDEQGRKHWAGTQADARAINRAFDQTDVPTDKPNLLAFLNEMQGLIEARAEPEIQTVEASQVDVEPEPEPTILPPVAEVSSDAVIEIIQTSEGSAFGWYLVATLERLGELRASGWAHVQSINRLFRHNGALERGLGALLLIEPPTQ